MARVLLGIMLMTSQILTGFWGGSTLCLRSDGTVCCIHEVTNPCNCCDHDHGDDEVPCSDDHGTHFHPVCQIAGNDEPEHHDDHEREAIPDDSLPAASPLAATPPCGCRHLPLLPGSAAASQNSASRTSSSSRQSRSAIPHVHSSLLTRCNDTVVECMLSQSPDCQTVGLTLVSSTVLRC